MSRYNISSMLSLMLSARSFLWRLNVDRNHRDLDDYAILPERPMTRDEAEALLRKYRHSVGNMK